MNIVEMFSKLQSGECKAHSELGTRDEAKQNRNFGTRISKMKTVTGINSRVLVFKDAVIPFNPFTGEEEEDGYNKKTPFRPILLVSQVLEGINFTCASNPELKAFWESKLGVSIPEGAPTRDEYLAFKKAGFVKPRIMSYYTVAINFNGIGGFPEFKVKYTVDPNGLNKDGTYDMENAPIWHQGASFFHACLKPEADDITKKLESQNVDKQTIKDQRRTIFQKSPVGFVSPTNLIPFLFFQHGEAIPEFDEKNPQAIEPCLRYYGYTDKWNMCLKESMSNDMFDESMDFFDFTVRTPDNSDVNKSTGKVYTDDDSNEIYQAMSISNTDGRMSMVSGKSNIDGKEYDNAALYAPVIAAAKRYFEYSQQQSMEDGDSFEKLMANSNRFRPITSVLENFLPACNTVFTNVFAGSPYFTEKIRTGHAAFFTAMNPANALALADKDEDELEEAAREEQAAVHEIIGELSLDADDAGTPDDLVLDITE